MSDPAGQKDLWKNVAWKNKDEKLAFFNKYFKNDPITANHVDKRLAGLKSKVISLIEEGEVAEGNKTRKLEFSDIVKMLKEE